MEMKKHSALGFILLLLLPLIGFTQESSTIDHNVHSKSFHGITLVMANTLVPNSFIDNTADVIVVPTFGFNYDYQFNSTWGIGIHTDIILQEYKIETHGNHEEVVRENPISISGIAFYKPHHRWKIIGGYGVEIEKNENFQLLKAGVEYGI